MRVLVCGGRNFDDRAALFARLDHLDQGIPAPGFTAIISGCARGADTLAIEWARKYGIPVQMFPANWERDGKAAGPIRNQQMLDEGKPDLVVAFSGGRGTADMVRRARAAGVAVIEAA